MSDVSTAAKRARLKKQHEPHWQKLSKGVYLGYRVGETNTWRARVRGRDGKQHFDTLQVKEEDIQLARGDEYTAAKTLCEKFAQAILGGGMRSPKLATIGEAIEDGYFGKLRKQGRTEAAIGAIRSKLGTCLLGNKLRPAQPLAKVMLADADSGHFQEWHDWLAALPIKNQTKNNYRKHVLAALNALPVAGYVCNPAAWAGVGPFATERHVPAAYLDAHKRSAYVSALRAGRWGDAAADFARGMYEGGARPIDAARARVRDFDAVRKTITFYTCKGDKREFRPYVHPLSDDAVEWLVKLTKGKLPTAYLFPTPRGGQWTKPKWRKAFRAARLAVNEGRATDDPCYLPENTRLNSWRHSKITDMLEYGRVRPLKVARRCGTSVAMIEATYFHIIDKFEHESVNAVKFAA